MTSYEVLGRKHKFESHLMSSKHESTVCGLEHLIEKGLSRDYIMRFLSPSCNLQPLISTLTSTSYLNCFSSQSRNYGAPSIDD